MFRFAKSAVNLRGVAARQVRKYSQVDQERPFHAKYGTGLLIGSSIFCVSVWTYAVTQTGTCWGLSPVGKVMPKEWREKEEE